MYKILLATDRPEILDAFQSIESWEAMGFRTPRIVSSAQAAMECLKAHHADAISYALSAGDEAVLEEYLMAQCPILPIFPAGTTHDAVIAAVSELRTLLNRTHADFSNDNFGEADMLQLCRHEFFRALLSENITSKQSVRDHMRLLRSHMDPEKPCVVVDMTLPQGEEYFAGRWHYGSERLEIALRNFFGAELNGMRMLVSVVAPDHVRLLCCPMIGIHGADTDESITVLVQRHAEEAMAQAQEFLDLELRIVNIAVLPSVTALAKE